MRRLRRTTTFGHVSSRERQNADRFFAELFGAAGPSASTPPAPLPSPAPLTAPRSSPPQWPPRYAAEAWQESEALPESAWAEDTPPAVTKGKDDDEIIVTRADGTRFHVRRKVRAQVFTDPGRVRGALCTDDDRVFFRVCWCKGTQGTIDFGANPQGAFKDLIKKVVDQINRGEDPEQIKQTLEDASIKTFLSADIAKGKDWLITGDIQLTINRSGITAATAGVALDKGWIKVGVEGQVGPDGKQVMLKVDIPLGKRTVPKKDCPKQELMVWWDVECLQEVPVTLTIQPPVPCLDRNERLFLYFDYMKDTLRRDPATPAATTAAAEVEAILKSDPTIGTARLNREPQVRRTSSGGSRSP